MLRNSLIPIISLWGLDMAQVIGGGAILTESVYNLHGVGQLAAPVDRPTRHRHAPRDRDADRVRRRGPGARRSTSSTRSSIRGSGSRDDATGAAPLLDVDELKVSFATEEGVVHAVDGVSFTVDRGEVVAIVGESGSGKSVTAMTLMGLTRGPNARFDGTRQARRHRSC